MSAPTATPKSLAGQHVNVAMMTSGGKHTKSWEQATHACFLHRIVIDENPQSRRDAIQQAFAGLRMTFLPCGGGERAMRLFLQVATDGSCVYVSSLLCFLLAVD